MLTKTLAAAISAELQRKNTTRENPAFRDNHRDSVDCLRQLQAFLPHGAGFDDGTHINFDKSTPEKLVLDTSFHHMNNLGFYTGWTIHTVTVTPTFDGLDVKVSGRDQNNIKDYIAEAFYHALQQTVSRKWDNERKCTTFSFNESNA